MVRSIIAALIIAIAFTAFLSATASAQDETPADALSSSAQESAQAAETVSAAEATITAPEEQAPPPSLAPATTPDPAALDRIQFGPGEILMGDIDRIHDGDLYFDSDEMDDVKLDFADITHMESKRVHTYRFIGRKVHSGTAVMDAEKIIIQTDQGLVEFPRGDLVGMVAGAPTEWNYWSGEATIGFTLRTGNTEQVDLSLFARLTRETALTRFDNRYTGSIASQDNETSANNHRFRSTFDVYLTRRFFLTVPSFEFYTAQFQNIDVQITPAVLVGYDVMANKWVTLEVGTGVGYQYTTAREGDTSANSNAAVIVTTGIDFDITSDIEWDTDYKINITPTDMNFTSQNLSSVLEFDIIGPIDIEAAFNFDRIKLPPETSPGVRPDSNDYRLTLGFGADF
jgi:hypothetical protein